jgi:dynein light chain LC8-type
MSDIDDNEEIQKGLPLLPYAIRSTQLTDALGKQVMAVVTEACQKHSLQKDIAEYIKREVDQVQELNIVSGKGPWQCIVGRSFAAAITHESSFSIFIELTSQRQSILLFKSLGVQTA